MFHELSEDSLSISSVKAYVTFIPKANAMLFEFLSAQELLKTIQSRHRLYLLGARCHYPPEKLVKTCSWGPAPMGVLSPKSWILTRSHNKDIKYHSYPQLMQTLESTYSEAPIEVTYSSKVKSELCNQSPS